MSDPQAEIIAEAFSRTAPKYDAFAIDHPHLSRLRRKVYEHLARRLPAGKRILELNAGTGIDAVELANRGYFVHATDIAPGMLSLLETKLITPELTRKISFQQCSFVDLEKVDAGPFDMVFSNFGGLNCIPDLSPVIQYLPNLLRPGGWVTWVLMPPVCLWELAMLFLGQFRLAFRRFTRGGTQARLEGYSFKVYYFTPGKVMKWFGKDFQVDQIEGLSVITPTAESKNFAKRFPRLYKLLAGIDDRLSPRYPWREWGDFYILSMRYNPGRCE